MMPTGRDVSDSTILSVPLIHIYTYSFSLSRSLNQRYCHSLQHDVIMAMNSRLIISSLTTTPWAQMLTSLVTYPHPQEILSKMDTQSMHRVIAENQHLQDKWMGVYKVCIVIQISCSNYKTTIIITIIIVVVKTTMTSTNNICNAISILAKNQIKEKLKTDANPGAQKGQRNLPRFSLLVIPHTPCSSCTSYLK